MVNALSSDFAIHVITRMDALSSIIQCSPNPVTATQRTWKWEKSDTLGDLKNTLRH